jgi:hypothetical protein
VLRWQSAGDTPVPAVPWVLVRALGTPPLLLELH